MPAPPPEKPPEHSPGKSKAGANDEDEDEDDPDADGNPISDVGAGEVPDRDPFRERLVRAGRGRCDVVDDEEGAKEILRATGADALRSRLLRRQPDQMGQIRRGGGGMPGG